MKKGCEANLPKERSHDRSGGFGIARDSLIARTTLPQIQTAVVLVERGAAVSRIWPTIGLRSPDGSATGQADANAKWGAISKRMDSKEASK
jgi:hypothetical protein